MDWEVAIMIRKGKDCGLEYGMISEAGASEPFVDLLRPSGFPDVVNSRPAWGIPFPIILAIPVCWETGAYRHAGWLDLEFIRTGEEFICLRRPASWKLGRLAKNGKASQA